LGKRANTLCFLSRRPRNHNPTFQVALEREFGGSVAVAVSSLVFAFAHFAHGILWPNLLVYFLVGVAFGATAYLTNSTLPAILRHIIGDLTFFTLGLAAQCGATAGLRQWD